VFRIFVLITLLPSAIILLGGGGPANLLQPGIGDIATPWALALTLLGGLALGLLFQRWRMAAPILLGAALASTALHAAEWAPGRMPAPVAAAGLVLLGVFIAQRFRILEGPALRATIVDAVGSFLVSMVAAAAFAALAAFAARVGFADALVAFAPGGLEAMMVLALVLGLDPLYVGVHHIARFLGIGFLLPILFTWLRRG
jgi:membrane AbrB-like protein